MNSEHPPRTVDEDRNPYAPPRAAIDATSPGDLAEAEAIRRAFIGHEASVKSIGALHFLGLFFSVLGAGGITFLLLKGQPGGGQGMQVVLLGSALFYFLLCGLHLALGIGLTRLKSWARWTDVVLISIWLAYVGFSVAGAALKKPPLLIGFGIAALIPVYILYLLVSPKSSTVFSPEYQAIIARTPHVKYRTRLLIKIVLWIFVVLVALGVVVAALFAPAR